MGPAGPIGLTGAAGPKVRLLFLILLIILPYDMIPKIPYRRNRIHAKIA